MFSFRRKSEKEKLGLIGADPTDIRDYQLASIQPKVVFLPNEIKLRDKMTSVQNQNWGTCTSHMADGIAEYSNSLEYKKEIKLSQKFIYYNTKKISGLWTTQGDYLRNALKAVCDYGAPLEEDFPDVKRNSWEEYIKDVPSIDIYEKAKKYKGKTFWSVGTSLDDFMQAIFQQNAPVGFGMMWYEGYRNIKNDGKLPLPSGKEIGGHAVDGVDWEMERFWVRNSWGTNWGNNGYFYIPFNEFGKHTIWNAWVMLDEEAPEQLTGWAAGKYLKRTGAEFKAGEEVTPIYSLNLREKPTIKSDKVTLMKPGWKCEIIEGGIDADGYTWWRIKII